MPSPGGHAEIAATVQGLISQHLDLSRPPWAMYLLHEPNREATALLLKLHHTVADGLGVIDVASRLLDPIPGRRAAGDATVGGPERGEGKEAAGSKGRPGAGRLGPRKWDRSGSTETTLGRGLRTVRGLVALARAGTAPPNSLNGPVDEARSFDFTEFGLREVEFVRQALGGTQNDVVLTVVGAALNRVLTEEANEVRTLRAMVPISLRRGTDRGRAGNWTSAISVPLPIASMAPQERLRLISEAARRLKRSPQPLAASFVMQFVGTTLPSPVHARVSRAMYRGKWFNLIVSTLRGADRPLRLAGATVAMAYPVLPLAEDVGLTVGAMTWCGKLTFGFTSHPGTAPDAEALADAARDAFDELLETAGGLSRPRTGSANTETEPPSPD